jgi:hypothetical protein
MANTKTQRKPLSVSPTGELAFGAIVKPSTTFKADGRYTATLLYEPKDPAFIKFTKEIDAVLAEYQAENPETADYDVQLPYGENFTKDKEGKRNVPTGKMEVRFGNNAVFEDKKTGEKREVRIPIFDSKNQRLSNPPIGRGSLLNVAYSAFGYTIPGQPRRNIPDAVGVGLRLRQVQIVKLVPYTGGGEPAFGAVDDGYVADTAAGNEETFAPEPDNGEGAGVIGGKKGNF